MQNLRADAVCARNLHGFADEVIARPHCQVALRWQCSVVRERRGCTGLGDIGVENSEKIMQLCRLPSEIWTSYRPGPMHPFKRGTRPCLESHHTYQAKICACLQGSGP